MRDYYPPGAFLFFARLSGPGTALRRDAALHLGSSGAGQGAEGPGVPGGCPWGEWLAVVMVGNGSG